MYIKSFKQLIVWQKSVELTTEIYKITVEFPNFLKCEFLLEEIQKMLAVMIKNLNIPKS